MPISQHDVQHYLESARDLAARVAKQADRIDCDRQLPSEPAGAELGHPDFVRILEVFAAVDASTAWCINQNNVFATSSVRMPLETAREIWDEKRAGVTNGPPTSSAIAVPVEGGYRLSGRWNFSSGSTQATWVAALTPVGLPDKKQDPSTVQKSLRVMLVPKEQVNFVDGWQVYGLRGTGSFGFEVDDLFVPNARTYEQEDPSRESGSLYVIPSM